MAGFKERISLIIDADSKAATSGLKSFGSSVREADGFTGKFKAGAASAFESVKANAGAMALAGGAALVAFGVKALGAFTDVAIAARDLGAATGLAVEDASRWIAVADDMGLSAADLTSGLGMVTKSLDDDKWAKYGIATRDAAGNARDANDILLDTFDVLSKETNLTERARLGKELLGKGYASLAPLIGKSRAEYEKALGAVEKGQVVTQKELEKSEKMRKAQDSLNDALGEFTLALGQAVAELSPVIEGTADLVEKFSGLDDSFKGVTPAGEAFGEMLSVLDSGPLGSVADSLKDKLKPNLEDVGETADETAGWMESLGEATDAATEAADAAAEAAKNQAAAEQELIDTAMQAASSMWDVEEATIKNSQAYADYVLMLDAGESSLADIRLAQIAQTQALADTAAKEAEAQGASATSREGIALQVTALQGMQEQYPLLRAEIQKYIDKLNAIPTNVNTAITKYGSQLSGGSGKKYDPKSKWEAVPHQAEGAINFGPTLAVVGDAPGGEVVLNKPQVQDVIEWAGMNDAGGNGAAGTNVNINVTVGPGGNPAETGRAVADALAAFYRNGGQRP